MQKQPFSHMVDAIITFFAGEIQPFISCIGPLKVFQQVQRTGLVIIQGTDDNHKDNYNRDQFFILYIIHL